MRRAGGGQAQAQSSAGQDKAERVLSQIRQKLGPELSVEYRVNQLMQEARNEEHLSRIFVGACYHGDELADIRLAIVAVTTLSLMYFSLCSNTPHRYPAPRAPNV